MIGLQAEGSSMQIGDEITWREMVRTKGGTKARFFTGVIVGERAGKTGREFEIAVRFLSGNLPDHPQTFMWVPEGVLLISRMTGHQHTNGASPLLLIKRRLRQQAQSKLDVILANINASSRAA
jgi:hypothetical protein